MMDVPTNEPATRPWIVCESGDRWLNALARFVPALMPRPLIARITSISHPDSNASPNSNVRLSEKVQGLLAGKDRAVVLWEVHPSDLALACDRLSATAIRWPNVLQLAAVSGLSDRDLITLSEFKASATLRHPEQLPSLAAMIHGYFANRS